MNLRIILFLLRFVVSLAQWLEREKWKAEGRKEANDEAERLHVERVEMANAARADADAINGLHNDPNNRDRL